MNKARQKESILYQLHSLRRQGSSALKTTDPCLRRGREKGNALIYVLIAVALFAALSLTLGKQTDSNEADSMNSEKVELVVSSLVSYAAQTKQVVDQMMFMNPSISDVSVLDLITPDDAAFETGNDFNKVYHPEGGGLVPGTLPVDAISQTHTDPAAGWYLSAFNNIDWTETTGTDLVLVAYQIEPQVCANINQKITGSPTIPLLNDSIKETLIDSAHFTAGANLDFTTDGGGTICPLCFQQAQLCVQSNTGDIYAYYSVIIGR